MRARMEWTAWLALTALTAAGAGARRRGWRGWRGHRRRARAALVAGHRTGAGGAAGAGITPACGGTGGAGIDTGARRRRRCGHHARACAVLAARASHSGAARRRRCGHHAAHARCWRHGHDVVRMRRCGSDWRFRRGWWRRRRDAPARQTMTLAVGERRRRKRRDRRDVWRRDCRSAPASAARRRGTSGGPRASCRCPRPAALAARAAGERAQGFARAASAPAVAVVASATGRHCRSRTLPRSPVDSG